MLPKLLHPKLLGMRNRWDKSLGNRTLVQDIFAIVLLFSILSVICYGTMESLVYLDQFRHIAYLSSAHLFAVVSLGLLVMSFLSNIVLASGSLYLSHDNDLILSSPISSWQFFLGKYAHTYLLASWMPFLFLLPILLAFGWWEGTGWIYYFLFPLFIVLFLSIPTSLGFIIAAVGPLCLPRQRKGGGIVLGIVAVLVTLALVLELLTVQVEQIGSAEQFLRFVQVLSLPNQLWLPSHWLSQLLESLLEKPTLAWAELATLTSCSLTFLCLSFLTQDLVFRKSRDRVESFQNNVIHARSDLFRNAVPRWLMSSPVQAVVRKDIRMLVRDFSQIAQLFFLCLLSWVYLYNLQVFRGMEALPKNIQFGWQHFLAVTNITIGAFLVTAMGLRFVYPSLSLEGRSFTILVSSPISIRKLVHIKFWFWYIPLAVVACLFFGIGSVAMSLSSSVVVVSVLSAAAIAYGVTGIAIGCGSVFGKFDWEHPGELVGSFGSLIYILLSIGFVLLCCIPSLILVYAQSQDALYGIPSLQVSLLAGLLLVFLNMFVARIGLSLGGDVLEAGLSR